ncbi:MAG: adenylyl-sulfate kinase, partial [Hyphomicrobiales bacterium]|nr:adenylyl-sulfate kinase [Hyphomicrobiales bacterium]
DFSFLVDGLKAEREQGITIDVAYRYFTTARRAFLIADAPGHEQYTRNQAAAASQTEIAVVLASAADGIQPQTRRHMAIAALFGVRDVILAVNKMDAVGFSRTSFEDMNAGLRDVARQLGLNVVAAIPCSAREGDNVVRRSAAMPWYGGETLLEALERFERPAPAQAAALLPIALTGRFEGGGRVSFGALAAGTLKRGGRLVSESGLEATVTRLWSAGVEVERADAGEAVAVELAPERDLGRGSVLGERPVAPATQVRARFVWLTVEASRPSSVYELQIGAAAGAATLARLEGRLDLDTLAMAPCGDTLQPNDIVVARLSLTAPLPALPFDESRALGAFILIDRLSRRTAAAGVVLSIERLGRDTPWQKLEITPADRARRMGQQPFVVWLTGLSGAGKSTIADLLDRRLHALGQHAAVLDGDNLRHGLNADLGFSDADRSENIRRVGQVAALMADAGLIVIVSLISPFRDDRKSAREVVGDARFLEVFVDAPLEICQQRDPKGMYARARAGTLPRFTGIAASYEPPEAPDLHLHTDVLTPEQAVEQVLGALRARGLTA